MALFTNPNLLYEIDQAATSGTVAFVDNHNSNGARNQHGTHYGMLRALDRKYGIRGSGVMPGSALGTNAKGKLIAWQQDQSGNLASYNKKPPAPFDTYAAYGPTGNIASITQDSAGVVKVTTNGRNYVSTSHVVDISGTDITGSGWSGGAKTDATVLTSPAPTEAAFYVAGTTSGSTNTGTYQASRNTRGGWWQLGLYIPAGSSITSTGWPLVTIDSQYVPKNNLRSCAGVYRMRYGVFNVGTSAPSPYDILPTVRDATTGTSWYLRVSNGVGTSGTASYISLSAGANAVATYQQAFPAAAARVNDMQMRPNFNADKAINGPWWLGSYQWWSTDVTTGCTVSQCLSWGGASMTEMAYMMTNDIQTSWIAEFLSECCQPAIYAGQRPFVVIRICESLNQRNETGASVPGGITPGDSKAAYKDSLKQLIKRWRDGWAATGLTGRLIFLLHRDHRVAPGDPDDSEMVQYQAAIEEVCAENPTDCCQVNPAELRGWMNPQEIDPIVNISAATVANPTEITTDANHGLTTGNLVMFRDVTGLTISGTVLNDTYYPVTVTAVNKFTVPMNVTASSSPTGKVYYTNASSGAHQTIGGYEIQCDIIAGLLKAGSQAYTYSLTNGVGNSRTIRTARS